MNRTIINNISRQRFETMEDDNLCYLEYRLSNTEMSLIHTFVPFQFRGKGIAADLVRSAISYAEGNGFTIIPVCPYVEAYLKRNKSDQVAST